MSTIRVSTGTEGPRHDPYSFTEYRVSRPDGREVVFHEGLGVWAEAKDGAAVDIDEKAAADLFEKYAGISVRAARKAAAELVDRRYRYHPCGLKHIKGVSGYPGESFVICEKCGDHLDYSFNLSEVE